MTSKVKGGERYESAFEMFGDITMDGHRVVEAALVQATGGTFAYAASVNLDVSAHNDFDLTPGTITGVLAITLVNGADGYQGTVRMIQDGTGHAVTFAASGRTVVVMGTIAITASKHVVCGYRFGTVNGVAYLDIFPSSN